MMVMVVKGRIDQPRYWSNTLAGEAPKAWSVCAGCPILRGSHMSYGEVWRQTDQGLTCDTCPYDLRGMHGFGLLD